MIRAKDVLFELSVDGGQTYQPVGVARSLELFIIDDGLALETRKLTAADFSHLEQRAAKVPKPAPRHGPRNRWGGLK